MVRLSILIPSVPRRREQLDKLLASLYPQSSAETEILVFLDDKKRSLGRKRNDMMAMAQGEYLAFVDDDDRVSQDYVQTLLEATKTGEDVINFDVEITTNGQDPRKVIYSKDIVEGYD